MAKTIEEDVEKVRQEKMKALEATLLYAVVKRAARPDRAGRFHKKRRAYRR